MNLYIDNVFHVGFYFPSPSQLLNRDPAIILQNDNLIDSIICVIAHFELYLSTFSQLTFYRTGN